MYLTLNHYFIYWSRTWQDMSCYCKPVEVWRWTNHCICTCNDNL